MRILLLLATITSLASAQEFHHFSGRVIDEKGQPIEGAFFDHTDMPSSEYLERFTNPEGIFDIWTKSPQILLRKSGYRDMKLTPKDANKHEFIMIKLTNARLPN